MEEEFKRESGHYFVKLDGIWTIGYYDSGLLKCYEKKTYTTLPTWKLIGYSIPFYFHQLDKIGDKISLPI